MYSLWVSALAMGAIVSSSAFSGPSRPLPVRMTADLLGDGRQVVVTFDPVSRTPVTVTNGARTVAVPIRPRWHPWRVALPDVDGDGRHEIVVALDKTTRRIALRHTCLFVYRYDGREVYGKWLGSTLGRPFTDFAFAHAVGQRGDLLVTLDAWLDGRRGITVHRWMGFGFQKVRSWGAWKRAERLRVQDGRVVVIADGRRVERALEGTK